MRRISITNTRADCLQVRVGRDLSQVGLWSALFAAVTALLFVIDREHPVWLGLWFVSLPLLSAVAVAVSRFARVTERTLVRANGRLLLDGEPIELARVELRVMKSLGRMPRGYALSLWVMTAVGPEDLPIGHSRTLLEASMLSGQVEEFVQRANVKQHRHA